MDENQHRKHVKRYNISGHSHLLTFSCYQRRALLADERWLKLLAQSVNSAVEAQSFKLSAYVFMPEHVHLLVCPQKYVYATSRLLAAIKRPFSYRVKQAMAAASEPALETLWVRERPGKVTFRFWQEGGGHDLNIDKPDVFLKAVEYIHANPVKRGLAATADLWKWSSFRYYEDPAFKNDPSLPRVHGFPE